MRGFALVLLACSVTPAMAVDPCTPESIVARLGTASFTRIDKVGGFDEPVLAEFARAFGTSKTRPLADPGEDFQATDVVGEDSLPWRRLVFGGHAGSITFIYYEKGGIALSHQLFVACSDGGTVRSYSYLAPLDDREPAKLVRGLRHACMRTPPLEHLEGPDIERCGS